MLVSRPFKLWSLVALDPRLAFAALPATLSKDLLDAFEQVVTNFTQHRWEPSELNGGKLCEAAFTIIVGYLEGGVYPARASKPTNMVLSCQGLEQKYPKAQGRSARIQIPRMLMALYEIRNNRGVGHAGGDVDPNEMDATAVLYMSKWLVAELVRLLHTLTTQEATEVVEALVERSVSVVWSLDGRKRVLIPGLSLRQQTLLLLSGVASATEAELVEWLEHKRPANLRGQVLRPLHTDRFIDYDEVTKKIQLLPPGIAAAEKLLDKLTKP